MFKALISFLTVLRYHGKCLKIARGKVKEDDKYTCPICDYRVKIPRDAARPKLEELIDWRNEIPRLPFIPDEKECLDRIIDTAQSFRDYIQPFTNSGLGLTQAEVPTMRFYLRKIEGAEILLAHETNFFRTELHRWMPIAPDPPPAIECSNSTRKPRPTKQQKLMAQYGVKNPEELPMTLRTKAHTFNKRKPNELNKPAPIKPAPSKGHSQPPTSSASMSPVQLHSAQMPVTPQFDYGSGFSMPSSAQTSPQYSQSSNQTSPIMINSLRGTALDPMLSNYPSQNTPLGRDPQYRDREDRNINHMFETLTNQEYTKESNNGASSSASGGDSGGSGTSSSGGHNGTSSYEEAAAAALQLTGDAIDPTLTREFLRDDA